MSRSLQCERRGCGGFAGAISRDGVSPTPPVRSDEPDPAPSQGERARPEDSAEGVAYSAGIVLDPAVGAALMAVSTVIVAINAKFLRVEQ